MRVNPGAESQRRPPSTIITTLSSQRRPYSTILPVPSSQHHPHSAILTALSSQCHPHSTILAAPSLQCHPHSTILAACRCRRLLREGDACCVSPFEGHSRGQGMSSRSCVHNPTCGAILSSLFSRCVIVSVGGGRGSRVCVRGHKLRKAPSGFWPS